MKRVFFEKLFRIILAVFLFALLFLVVQEAIRFKWPHDENMYELYGQEKEVDVLYCGASNTYAGAAPAVIWHESGYTGYNIASSSINKMMIYYQLKCAFRRNVPKLVVIDISGMIQDKDLDKDAAKYELPYRKISSSLPDLDVRLEMINTICSRYKSQSRLDYLFPLLRYHSRWEDLTCEDLQISPEVEGNFRKGCITNTKVAAQKWPEKGLVKKDAVQANIDDLEKVVRLCQDQGCKVLFIYYPKVLQYTGDYEVGKEFAEKYGTDFVSFTTKEEFADAGLDIKTDFYDHKHLNIYGQKKFSEWFGRYLKEHYDFGDHSDDSQLSAEWDQAYKEYMDYYNEQKKARD